MNRRGFVRVAAAITGGLTAARPLLAANAGRRLVERWSWVMGQSAHVQIYADSEDRGLEAASVVLAELRRIEARLSRFDDASDLCELNRMAGRSPLRVGPDLVAVLGAAAKISAASFGAFNVAVEPLMRAWGFRDPRRAAPSERDLAEARQAVAAAEIRIADGRVFLPSAVTELDLGGIGVGYGLDRAEALLRAAGIERALIDVSGDCLALGAPPGEPGWTIGIASPGRRGALDRTVLLADRALATSSNLESVVRLGAMVAGHVMNPLTGHPAQWRQATVMARRGIDADALSTAALVTGPARPVAAVGHASFHSTRPGPAPTTG